MPAGLHNHSRSMCHQSSVGGGLPPLPHCVSGCIGLDLLVVLNWIIDEQQICTLAGNGTIGARRVHGGVEHELVAILVSRLRLAHSPVVPGILCRVQMLIKELRAKLSHNIACLSTP